MTPRKESVNAARTMTARKTPAKPQGGVSKAEVCEMIAEELLAHSNAAMHDDERIRRRHVILHDATGYAGLGPGAVANPPRHAWSWLRYVACVAIVVMALAVGYAAGQLFTPGDVSGWLP